MTRALDTLRAVFEALEPRRSDWRVLYDSTLPAGSEPLERVRHYRQQLLVLAAEGTGDVLGARELTDPRQLDLATRLWTSTVIATVEWWLDHPEVAADEMVVHCAGILSVIASYDVHRPG